MSTTTETYYLKYAKEQQELYDGRDQRYTVYRFILEPCTYIDGILSDNNMSYKYIEFKTKAFPIIQSDGTKRLAIRVKKTLSRTDTNLQPHDHPYFNSDLFPVILNRYYRRVIGEYRDFVYLDSLPEGMTVDTSKFLAVVRIELILERS